MKRIHSILALVLCMALLFGLLPSVQAVTTEDGIEYVFKGDGSVEIVSYSGEERDIVIPASIDGYPVTSIGRYAYRSHYMRSLTIPDSVTNIDEGAFSHCSRLTSITLPGSIETIGHSAFSLCSDLRDIQFPEGIKTIGRGAFSGCEKLENIIFSGTIETIDYAAFSGCAFKELVIPDNVKSIASNAFHANEELERLSIGDGVEFIGEHAFENCRALKLLELGVALKEIGTLAFKNCDRISHIFYHGTEEQWNRITGTNYLPQTTRHYESNDDCVIFSETCSYNQAYCGICENYFYCVTKSAPGHSFALGQSICRDCNAAYGLLYHITDTEAWTLSVYGYSSAYTDLVINSIIEGLRVTHIEDDAFHFSDKLTSITVADGIVRIGWRAFHSNEGAPEKVTIYSRDCAIMPSPTTLGSAEHTTIYAYKGSTAESYASEFGYKFVALPENENPDQNPFTDVKETDYFAEPVRWAVEKEITNGVNPTNFAPNAFCTRAQIVTFLWRACGSPEPTFSDNPFLDVNAGDYYYKAVLWAVENGITTGIRANEFAPHETCTRGQVATFLWRAQGKPAPTNSNNPFADVKSSDYYYEAVLWAVENNVTQGTGVGKFSPNDSCTRGQIVTFLYRALN